MTPAARVQAAIELLDDILGGTPAEKVLTTWARRSRYAGSKDRAAVRDHVYDVLRRKRSALPLGSEECGRSLMLGLLAQDGAEVETLFSGLGYGPDALSSEEKAVLPEAASIPDTPDIPDWMEPHLQDALQVSFPSVALSMRTRAPVFLRVNFRKSSRADAMGALQNDGISTQVSSLSDSALQVTEGARRVAASGAYSDGLVELQDASSQAAIEGLPLDDGMRILDYCAGGGGKTLAMGARTQATFVAHDAHVARMRDLPTRANRAGLDVTVLDLEQLESEAPFDLVFCDVPCSGSGTWRRTPDAKWRFESRDLDNLLELQMDILEQAKTHVGKAGMLIFATCSLLREENENQIEAFLANNPSWSCVSSKRWSPVDGCDGFFLAQLTKST